MFSVFVTILCITSTFCTYVRTFVIGSFAGAAPLRRFLLSSRYCTAVPKASVSKMGCSQSTLHSHESDDSNGNNAQREQDRENRVRQLLRETPIDWDAIVNRIESLPSNHSLFSTGQDNQLDRTRNEIAFTDLLGQHAPLDAVKAIHANWTIRDLLLISDSLTTGEWRLMIAPGSLRDGDTFPIPVSSDVSTAASPRDAVPRKARFQLCQSLPEIQTIPWRK